MHPEIKSTLENHDIPSMTSADFLNRNDYEIINSDCTKLFSYLEFNIKQNISNYYSKCFVDMFLYYTYFAFYTIAWNARLLQNIFDIGNYSKFITFTPNKNFKTTPWFVSEQNILHLLLPQLIADKSIDHLALKGSGDLKRGLIGNSMLFTVRKLIRPVYSFLLRQIYSIEKNTYKILVPNTDKNMNLLCAELNKKNKNICFFVLGAGKSVSSELYKFFILLKYFLTKKGVNDPNLNEGTVVKISLSLLAPIRVEDKSGFVSEYFKKLMLYIQDSELELKTLSAKEATHFYQMNKIHHILSYLQYQQSLSMGLERFLKLCKPDMIFSHMSQGLTSMLGFLAETLGIPSMLISHGSHISHTEGAAALEHDIIARNMLFGGYRYLGIQTSLSYEYVLREKITSHSIVKITPTILLNNQSKINNKEKLTVLHAGTIKDGAKRFLYETPDELLETFQETIEILSTCKNLKLIIKFRQIQEFSFKSLKFLLGNLPENVSLVSDAPFGEFLASSHLLMSYSSTTIEEALINDTPVLLYGGKGRYSHIPTEPFKLGNKDDILTPVTFVNNRKSLAEYFTVLDEKICKIH